MDTTTAAVIAAAYPEMTIRHHGNGLTKVVIYSFGYLHENGVPARLAGDHPEFVADVRGLFRDPHHDPAFRQLTGRDDAVRARVLDQPGARPYVDAQSMAMASLVHAADRRGTVQPKLLRLAFGCAGGRHRSVALADAVALRLNSNGIGTEVVHLHIRRPVVNR